MPYVKTRELVGRRVQLLGAVTTNRGARFIEGDTFVVTGLIVCRGATRKLELQCEGDGRRLLVWRRRVRLLDAWPPEESFACCGGTDEHPPEHAQDCATTVVDAVRIVKGQRFDVCPKCGKRGVYRCPRRGVMRCRYCKRYADGAAA
jgi:hypothetical protein